MARGPDGEWQWPDVRHGEHAGMRYAYYEREVLRIEDALGIEMGDRVARERSNRRDHS
jgi:hypothetical protein